MEIGDLVIVIFVIGLVVTAPFLTGLMRKILEKFSGNNNDFESESHQIAPTFASDVSEVAKSSVLHGIGYVHGGVGSTRTGELRAQRKKSKK